MSEIHGYFPIEYNFGSTPCDDPSLINIVTDPDFDHLGTVSLAKMITDMIDGSKNYHTGEVVPDQAQYLVTMRDFLRAQLDKIDEVLKSAQERVTG